MKIIKLTAENVKRLKAVEINPDGTVQVITGRNAQGKTSVLDAIWLALGGGVASRETKRPIRDGEESASVTLDLGDLVVTRTWKGNKTSLSVSGVDGAKYSSPQSMLDALVGRLSFDPLEFTRLSGRDQVAALLELVDLGIDLPKLDADRERLYDDRHAVGLKGKAIGEVPEIDTDVPDEEVAASQILTRIRSVQANNEKIRSAHAACERLEAINRETRVEIEEAQERLKEREAEAKEAQELVKSLGDESDTGSLEADLQKVEETNRLVRANKDAKEKSTGKDALRAEYDTFTTKIDALDKKKATALAKAKFPVDGLGFDDGGVTYQGVPFSQSSSAEQIRVSLAMAMSLNPDLRVIRILDGSLLDAENLALISDMAKEKDYQVWIERVADGSGVGVVIEDGQVSA